MEPREDNEPFGGDTCEHCGATALESFDCALNGCRFGLVGDDPPQALSTLSTETGEKA